VIEAKRLQRSFGDGLIAEEIEELQETWMRHVDVVLQDEGIISAVYGALAKRCPHSRSRGRPGYPAEVVLRLLILKHVRNWSYAVLEREVRANLVYRDFTRVGVEGSTRKPAVVIVRGQCLPALMISARPPSGLTDHQISLRTMPRTTGAVAVRPTAALVWLDKLSYDAQMIADRFPQRGMFDVEASGSVKVGSTAH
jgi:transposase-like protein DUF772